jgi:CheY-like chemotaxis protein
MKRDKPLVFVIDDDPDSLDITARVLGAGRLDCRCFSETRDALDRLAEETPDLFVSDLMMDSLHAGFAFAARVKADPRTQGVPVVMVTAVGSRMGLDFAPRSAADLAALNVDAFFPKPLRAEPFLAKVWELLARRDEPGSA